MAQFLLQLECHNGLPSTKGESLPEWDHTIEELVRIAKYIWGKYVRSRSDRKNKTRQIEIEEYWRAAPLRRRSCFDSFILAEPDKILSILAKRAAEREAAGDSDSSLSSDDSDDGQFEDDEEELPVEDLLRQNASPTKWKIPTLRF